MKREAPPLFTIHGNNNEGPFEFAPAKFFKISRTKSTVIIGTLLTGTFSPGDQIVIHREKKDSILDTVKDIQREKKSIPYAVAGERIAISLQTNGLRKLRKHNNEPKQYT